MTVTADDLRSLGFGASLRGVLQQAGTCLRVRSPKSLLRSFIEGCVSANGTRPRYATSPKSRLRSFIEGSCERQHGLPVLSPKSRLRSFIDAYPRTARDRDTPHLRSLGFGASLRVRANASTGFPFYLRSLGFGASLRVAIGDATQDTIRSPKSRLRSFIEGRQAAATDIHLRISEVSASELH